MEIQNNSIVTDADTDVLDSQITQISNDFAETYYFDNEQQEELEMLVAKCMKLGELYERKKWQAAKAQAVPEWIETAIQPPEEGQKVIISGIYGVGIAEFSYLYKDEFVMYDMGASNPILSKDQVKFWQPLPDAPREPTNG